jgi:DNA-binding IscR family transcriptional regulator
LREGLYDRRAHAFQEWLALSALAEITRRHLSGAAPWLSTELAASLGVSSLENCIDRFVRARILLRSVEPQGIALARPPEDVTINEILHIVRGSEGLQEISTRDGVGDLLNRRDQAVQQALEGMTLKSLAAEIQPQSLRVSHSGSGAQLEPRVDKEHRMLTPRKAG